MQFSRLQDIPVRVEIKEKVSAPPRFLEWFEQMNMERQAGELTSSASSPDRGFCCAGPRGAVWCPAVLQSASCISSSPAAMSAAHLHYQPAHQPAAGPTITHVLYWRSRRWLFCWYTSMIRCYSEFLAFLSRCLLPCCSVSSLSSNSCWSFFLVKSISRMARLYFIRHSPPGEKRHKPHRRSMRQLSGLLWLLHRYYTGGPVIMHLPNTPFNLSGNFLIKSDNRS